MIFLTYLGDGLATFKSDLPISICYHSIVVGDSHPLGVLAGLHQAAIKTDRGNAGEYAFGFTAHCTGFLPTVGI